MNRSSVHSWAPSLPATSLSAPLRTGIIAVGIICLLVAFAALIDMALQVNNMSASLVTVNSGLRSLHARLDHTNSTLRQVSLKLTLTNELLHATNLKVLTTNGKLDGMNVKLDVMNGKIDRTNGGLAKMQQSLTSLTEMRQTLSGMASDIKAMTRKITHAKLLF